MNQFHFCITDSISIIVSFPTQFAAFALFSFHFVIFTTISFDLRVLSQNNHTKKMSIFWRLSIPHYVRDLLWVVANGNAATHINVFVSTDSTRFFIWYYLQLSISVRFCFLLILIKTPRKQYLGLSSKFVRQLSDMCGAIYDCKSIIACILLIRLAHGFWTIYFCSAVTFYA